MEIANLFGYCQKVSDNLANWNILSALQFLINLKNIRGCKSFTGGESYLPDTGFLRLSLEFSSRYSDVTVCSVRNTLVTYYTL